MNSPLQRIKESLSDLEEVRYFTQEYKEEQYLQEFLGYNDHALGITHIVDIVVCDFIPQRYSPFLSYQLHSLYVPEYLNHLRNFKGSCSQLILEELGSRDLTIQPPKGGSLHHVARVELDDFN